MPGSGSFRKYEGKRGSTWGCTISLPRDPYSGERKQIKKRGFRTRAEAEQWRNEVLYQLDRNQYVEPTKVSLAEFMTDWLDSVRTTLRESSMIRYERTIRLTLPDHLRSVQLSKLTPLMIQKSYQRLLQSGASPQAVNQLHKLLRRALKQAVAWRMLNSNPTDGLTPPKAAPAEMNVWNQEQVRMFLDGVQSEPQAALWTLAILTGMRRGELMALHWKDVDLDRRELYVRHTLTQASGGWVIGEPKSGAGRRTIALSDYEVSTLRRHRQDQLERRLAAGSAWHDTDLVFERGDGRQLDSAYMQQRLPVIIKRLDLPYIRCHDLRHTNATMLLSNRVPINVVSQRLGHANTSITLDVYGHVLPHQQHDAVDTLSSAIFAGDQMVTKTGNE